MKEFRFNIKKSKWLKTERNIDFNDIIDALKKERLIKVIDHPNKKRYPKQRIFLIEINKYVYVTPFVEENDHIFLKTIYKSHKYTRKYLKKL